MSNPSIKAGGSCGVEALPLFTASFIVGLFANSTLGPVSNWPLLFLSVLAAFLSLLPAFKKRLPSLVMLCISAMLVGGWSYGIRTKIPQTMRGLEKFEGSTGLLTGSFNGGFSFLKSGGMRFIMRDPEFVFESQRIKIAGDVLCTVDSIDHIPFPEQYYAATGTLKLSADGNRIRFSSPSIVPATTPGTLFMMAASVKGKMVDSFDNLLTVRHKGMMKGFLLGDTSELDPRDRASQHRAGLSHLMAVSGQHIMILVLVLLSVFHWLGIPPLSRSIAIVGIIGFYALLTAGNPSVWRALIMFAAAVISTHIEATPGPIRPVALAALFLLIVEPDMAGEIGFQLSFAALLGIVLGVKPVERGLERVGLNRTIARYLSISVMANVAVAPLSMYHFGLFSPASFIVNPMIGWLFSVILPMGFIMSIVWHFWAPSGLLVASGLSFILDGFLIVTEYFASFEYSIIRTGYIPGFAVMLIYCGILFTVSILNGLIDPVRVFGAGGEAATRDADSETAEPAVQPIMGGLNDDPDSEKQSYRLMNPLIEVELISAIDQQLGIFPRRALKLKGNLEHHTFPVNRLVVESQNLYHSLQDLSVDVLRKEPDRLLQAQVWTMAILGGELLTRVTGYLDPPPSPAELSTDVKVKSRYLATVVLTELFFRSRVPARAGSTEVATIVGQAQKLHQSGTRTLSGLIRERGITQVEEQMEFRKSVFNWCRNLFIQIESGGLKKP